MKKTIKIAVLIIIGLALTSSSFFIGYYSSQGDLPFVENKANVSFDNDVDNVHSVYNNYLLGESGKKFLRLKDADEDWYGINNKNCIDKDILFFDIDNDKVDECVLNVKFEYGFEYVYIFDMENSQIRLVNDSELLWNTRSNVKFRLIQVSTGEYRILKYIQDANKAIIATVYNYNGYSMVPYKSFFANTYKYNGYDGEYFLSKEVDFLKEDYQSYKEYSGPDESYKISEEDFYCQWDFYTSCCKMFIVSPEIEEF